MRVLKGLSQPALASAAGISESSIHNLERYADRSPSLRTVGRICKGLKVTFPRLMGWTVPRKKKDA